MRFVFAALSAVAALRLQQHPAKPASLVDLAAEIKAKQCPDAATVKQWWAHILEHVDTDESGTISWAELTAAWPEAADYKDDFDAADKSGDGHIDWHEFKAAVAHHCSH